MKLVVLGAAAVAAILTAFVLQAEDQGECTALLAHPSGDRVGYRDGDTWYDDVGEVIAFDEKTRIMAGSVGCPVTE